MNKEELNLKNIDFSKLKPNEIGTWPLILRILVIIAACIGAVIAANFLVISEQENTLQQKVQQQESLRGQFRDKYLKTINYDIFKKKLQDMETSLNELFKRLPTKDEVPALIEAISKLAAANGLDLLSIVPKKSEQKADTNALKKTDDKNANKTKANFLEAQTWEVELVGSYHQIGRFLSKVAAMPRIVTLHDFTLEPKKSNDSPNKIEKSGENLSMKIILKTYWTVPNDTTDNKKK